MNIEKTSGKEWAISPKSYIGMLYHVILGRDPDPVGLQQHVNNLLETGDPTIAFRDFVLSPEGKRHISITRGSSDWINDVMRADASDDAGFNDILHKLRTEELKRSEGTAGTLVSIGASNHLYFDWIHETLGKPAAHIGLEYYSPKPAVLPDNVRWIANTAGNMVDVASGSVDLIFGGQVIEHLWADELVSFLHECCRVLRKGGRLIFDTPNEKVTRYSGWTHSEHTLEFRPADGRLLLKSLGFEVTKVVGHWLCEDETGYLRLNRIGNGAVPSTEERIRAGYSDPDRSFNWWIEARYVGGAEPDREITKMIVKDMWERYAHHKFNRTTTTGSDTILTRGQGKFSRFVSSLPEWAGPLLSSSANALPPGRIRVAVELDAYQFAQSPGRLEVRHPQSGRVFGSRSLPAVFDGGLLTVEAEQPTTVFDCELSLMVNGTGPLTARMAFFIEATVFGGEMWNLSPRMG